MTGDQLTALLAENIMGWTVGPERFVMADRKWIPRWRFTPLSNLDHAIRLLRAVHPQEYSIYGRDTDNRVKVTVNGRVGLASATSLPLAITAAVARASGIEVPTEACFGPIFNSRRPGPSGRV